MKIILDREKCCGSGQCVLTAPALFDQGEEDGLSVLLRPYADAEQHEAVRQAVLVCPGRAISIE
ncbi:ferredoxin [Nonomuraea mesophila]|uniref:Ferredoxin n=1 Tax=Nonomuraea mesophila TaxID=2530382 RepID=A0A4V2ZBD6_9ACTN|nr:ferredoxin [Nonomuraea mesophila]TDE56571.1 ferredoxin [Nonomuraea mesophila]